MNATIEDDKEEAIVGQYGLGTRYYRGRKLNEFWARNELILTHSSTITKENDSLGKQ